MKKHLIALVSALIMALPAMAQSESPQPHAFFGVQGGISKDYIHTYKNWKPTASAYVGYMFTPVVGARLHANGIWTNGFYAYSTQQRFDHKYLTGNVDALFNLCNANNREKLFPVNAYWITGIGVRHAWDADFPMDDMKWAANGRLGFALDVPLCKYASINAEVDMNNYIHRTEKHHLTDNVQLTCQLGLAFKFGHRAPKAKPVEEEVVERASVPARTIEPQMQKSETVAKPAKQIVDVPAEKKPENIRKEVFYTIRESNAQGGEEQKVAELVSWLKDHPNAKVTVTGYADAGTGTPAVNKKYAQQRADKVRQALVDAGIDASRITTDSKGDTVQPFADNDKNRCVIAVAAE